MTLRDRLNDLTKHAAPQPIPMTAHVLHRDVFVLGVHSGATKAGVLLISPICLAMEVHWIQEPGILWGRGHVYGCGDAYQYLLRDPQRGPLLSTRALADPIASMVDEILGESRKTADHSFNQVEFEEEYFLSLRRAAEVHKESAARIRTELAARCVGQGLDFHPFSDEGDMLKFLIEKLRAEGISLRVRD